MYYVYILSNKADTVLYVGVTNDITRRVAEHSSERIESFTKRYHVHKLIYYEEYTNINDAIAREKQIKHWSRMKKNILIASKNPEHNDLIFAGKGKL
ncbi:MAG: GIY-YIG nuclease family protein [Clostridia bacterium]|nr:GIY-YIG nuclease family protein [Clostridia bacterium]